MNRRIISLLLSILLIICVLFTVSCEKTDPANDDTEGLLLADFEDISKCTQSMIFYYNFGRMTLTNDAKYVTHGNSAAKINAMGDEFIASGAPCFEIVVPESERDFSKLKKITFDAFNDTDGVYRIGVYLKLSNANGIKTLIKHVELKVGEPVKVSPSFDVGLLSVGYDLKNVYSIGFEFNKVGQHFEGKNDVYMDNLRIVKYEKEPEGIDVTLNENELCSFDHLWQSAVCFPTSYAAMPGFEMNISVNTDLRYVKSGKSLKLEIPSSWPGLNWDWPYLKFAEKYVENMNLSQYKDNDTISLWVYSDNDFVVPFSLHFWRKSSTEDRGAKGYQLGKGWNHLTWTFGEINAQDLGVGKITDDLSDIRFVFSNVGADVTLYFDEFEIIKGE